MVGPDGRNLPKPQPGQITVEGLHYVPNSIRYFDPISTSELRIAFAAQAGNLTGAAVYSLAGQTWRRDELYLIDTRAGMDFFRGWWSGRTPHLTYFFEVKNGATDRILRRRQILRPDRRRPPQCLARPRAAGLQDAGLGSARRLVSNIPRAIP